MKKPWVALVSVLLALSFALAGRGPLAVMPAPSWDGFVNHFIEAYFVAHPDFAVDAGRHEFDGKLPDWSPAALSKEAERLRSARRQALDLDPASLDERERLEHDYLVSVIDRGTSSGWKLRSGLTRTRCSIPERSIPTCM
jgi:hypothetical protein